MRKTLLIMMLIAGFLFGQQDETNPARTSGSNLNASTFGDTSLVVAEHGRFTSKTLTELLAMLSVGETLSSIIKWKIARIGGHTSDALASDAVLLEFDIHYQKDADGSRQEYIK